MKNCDRLRRFVLTLLLAALTSGMAFAIDGNIVYVSTDSTTGDYICDGVNDEVEINRALTHADTSATIDTVYLRGGLNGAVATYWIDATLYVGSKTTLTGDTKAKIKLIGSAGWAKKVPMITNRASGNRDIIIHGFELDGNEANNPEGSGLEYYTIIYFTGVHNCKVHDMWLHDNKNDACLVKGNSDSVFFYNNTVRSGHDAFYGYTATHSFVYNNYIDLDTNCAVRIDSGNYAKIYNNVVNGATGGGSGFQFQNNTGGPTMNGIEVYNNTVYNTVHPGIWAFTSKDQASSSLIKIYNNVFYNCGTRSSGTNYNLIGGILTNGWNMTVENNVFYQCYGAGVRVIDSPNYSTPAGSGYTITMKNNIITNSRPGLYNNGQGGSGYGVQNALPSSHTITMYNNCLHNNAGGDFYGSSLAHTADVLSNPQYADSTNHDYHLKSKIGRWNGTTWVTDGSQSPCIDAGYPDSDYSNEPAPNGNRINIGRYGNTTEASKSDLAGVDEVTPPAFSLSQNAPNPFNPSTMIAYTIPTTSAVTMTIYTVQGQKVETLVNGKQTAGVHTVEWKPENLASGIFLCRMDAGNFTKTMKLVYMK